MNTNTPTSPLAEYTIRPLVLYASEATTRIQSGLMRCVFSHHVADCLGGSTHTSSPSSYHTSESTMSAALTTIGCKPACLCRCAPMHRRGVTTQTMVASMPSPVAANTTTRPTDRLGNMMKSSLSIQPHVRSALNDVLKEPMPAPRRIACWAAPVIGLGLCNDSGQNKPGRVE